MTEYGSELGKMITIGKDANLSRQKDRYNIKYYINSHFILGELAISINVWKK